MMVTPDIIKHLRRIGFTEEIGEWCPVWGQGDGEYWHGKLTRGKDTVYTDRDNTLYQYTWNGVVMPKSFFFDLTKDDSIDYSDQVSESLKERSFTASQIIKLLNDFHTIPQIRSHFINLLER